jgi:cytochrome c-type biogenesis protein CcmH/NrfF
LSDSDAPIAEDLRNELFSLLDEGYSDQEIRDFMTARYGTFVLYQPPLTRFTLALWLLPLGLLLISGLIIWRMTGKPRGLADPNFEHHPSLQKVGAVNAGIEPISMKVDALDRHIAELERTHEHDK